ncbi:MULTISPECIES: hypothetical protein [Pseudoalteromonas]|uniref:Uncharacterized protein n=1 Tax=Pseudoalteromonas luteoviolacea (strain 2ta16) TaxID=1353533 RepID=V4HUW5_PSEL2|nr:MULTISPECIES: hypothetical protein [Pseudoalteromonas]ESP91709.1 hypothetical protein PL2TA16_05349 [Pseudoalteromonas luteoviolacea 2ta16]KZN40811.1 hypothetical protein N483_16930 [Pseudoalteromonas luteoviolacea NCIMB 1944]MCG7546686.1 hypothetical protein [Pseudoalteromonas sp. Of7M-16]
MKLKLTKNKIKELSNNKNLSKEQTHAVAGASGTIGETNLETPCRRY